jgi:hypothetical protein
MTASLSIHVIRSSPAYWRSMKKECRHARHNCLFLNQNKLRKFLNLIQCTFISDSMFQFNLTLVPSNSVQKKHFYTWCAGLIVHALLTPSSSSQLHRLVQHLLAKAGPWYSSFSSQLRTPSSKLARIGSWCPSSSSQLRKLVQHLLAKVGSWVLILIFLIPAQ